MKCTRLVVNVTFAYLLFLIILTVTFSLKIDENPVGQGNGNTGPSEMDIILPPLVECDGIFQKGKLSTELNLTIRTSKQRERDTMTPGTQVDADAFDVCTHVQIVIKDATLINWTEVNTLQIKIPKLNFFFLDLVIPPEKNLTEAEYVGIVGWKNFLFFEHSIKKPEGDIWTSGVGFGISINGQRILFYDPLPGHNQMFLMIGPFIDADDVVSGFNPFLRLRSLSLFNCKINNLATILSGELARLEIVNVDYPSFEGFIKRCKSLEHLTLRMKGEKFDLPISLTSKQIEKIEIENVTLVSSRKTTELDKLDALSSVRFQNCKFDKSFKENRAWTIFSGLRHLELSTISDLFDLSDLSVLPCKEFNSLYISNSNLTYTKKTEAAKASLSPLPLESLYFKNCTFDTSIVKNIWELFPDVKNLAVVSNLDHTLKPNPEFLDKALTKLPNIKWIHYTNFNWSSSSSDLGKKMSTFLQQTKGELKGTEENFVLRLVEGRKWLGWKYISRKEYDEWELYQLMNSETPPEPYVTAKLEITTAKTEVQSYSEWSDYFWKLNREILNFIISDDQPLSINESWSAERNMSIVVDGFIVLNIGHGDGNNNEKEISIARLNAVSKILSSIRGSGNNLTKLALLQVGIEEFDLLQCETLKKLFIRSVSFEERDVNMSTITSECGELTELILFPASPYDSAILEIDLRTGLKSKKLQKLVIDSANVSLTWPMTLAPPSTYDTLEDFYLDSVDLQPSFLENFWKFYPNLKRIGIGYTRTRLPNPLFLKSILENLKQVEWIYFYNFEWGSTNAEANSEMERFVFSTKGKLLGNETHFALQKPVGDNGKWIGIEFDASQYDHQLLEFQVLHMDYFFTDYSRYVDRTVLI